MKIRCRSCGYSETLNKELIVTLLGGAVAGFGFWAWVSFLFAGTGFAMPICIAIVVGGPALAIKYGDEIVEWLAKKGYECKKCNAKNWMSLSEEANKLLDQKIGNPNKIIEEARQEDFSNLTNNIESKKPRIKFVNISLPFQEEKLSIKNEKTLSDLRLLAQINNGEAENKVAEMYYEGKEVERSYSESAYWANIAAQKGNSRAKNLLSILYKHGWGVERSDELADFWSKKYLHSNEDLSNLTIDFSKELIVDPEQIEKIKSLSKINDGGAENLLAKIYYAPIKTSQNYSRAFKWSLISAKKGNKDAQLRLGNLYRRGWGTSRNEELAQFWLKKSREK